MPKEALPASMFFDMRPTESVLGHKAIKVRFFTEDELPR